MLLCLLLPFTLHVTVLVTAFHSVFKLSLLLCRYGFVVYGDGTVTDVACKGLNGMRMGDRTLTVRRATEVMFSRHVTTSCLQISVLGQG